MSFTKKDIYRGLILCELTTGSKPTSLCLIETGGLESKQVMEINAVSYLYFKYGNPIGFNTNAYQYRWQFVFSPNNINQLSELKSKKEVGLALVCVNDKEEILIAFISSEKINDVLDLNNEIQQIINVHKTNTNRIEVIANDKKFGVPKDALRRWNP